MTERAVTPEVLVCRDLDRAITLFTRLGLRLDAIYPADDPAVAELSGAGAAVRVVRTDATEVTEPGAPPPVRPSYVVVRADDTSWGTGRAGMQYRDLIPGRQGGRYIASHIRIPDGGPVPDYVHYHAIQFQIIYVYRGWVRVVYEDQGEPFVMHAGECVLQPSRIRHRVLEASPGLEVIELGLPAVHATYVDHALALPTAAVRPDREFGRELGGQRFVRYQPAAARFMETSAAGFEAAELGIREATRGLGSVHVLRVRDPERAAQRHTYRHAGDLVFHFVLRGQLQLDELPPLGAAEAFVVPAGQPFTWRAASPELELLQVALPGDAALIPA